MGSHYLRKALSFLLLTLEAKYHCTEGEYSSLSSLRLPLICAIGGVIVPISIYLLVTFPNAEFIRGWAVTLATDTAFVLALFAFLNSEIAFKEISTQDFISPITLGTASGLFFGKQIGVMLFAYLAIKLNICKLPKNVTQRMFYGIATLTGIGFTFSLFIGVLSFDDDVYITQMKLGVLIGSFLSALLGITILRHTERISRKM